MPVQTPSARGGRQSADPGGRPRLIPEGGFADLVGAQPEPLRPLTGGERQPATGARLELLVREWLTDLAVLGRSERTIGWYQHKMRQYLATGGPSTLPELTAFEFKRFWPSSRVVGSRPNTVHGFFEVIKGFRQLGAARGMGGRPGAAPSACPQGAGEGDGVLQRSPTGNDSGGGTGGLAADGGADASRNRNAALRALQLTLQDIEANRLHADLVDLSPGYQVEVKDLVSKRYLAQAERLLAGNPLLR